MKSLCFLVEIIALSMYILMTITASYFLWDIRHDNTTISQFFSVILFFIIYLILSQKKVKKLLEKNKGI